MTLKYLSKQSNTSKAAEYEFEFHDFEIVNSNHHFSMEKYICVSYAWENISTKHPYNDNIKISDRTLAVIQTAYYSYQQLLKNKVKDIVVTDKIWIDSICIPSNRDESEIYYNLMGEIYAKSSVVIVVLSKELENVLNKFRNSIQLSEEDFELLNKDKWVSRQWTYQEIVNAGKIYFNSEQSTENPIFATDFFDKIANDIETFTRSNKLSTIDFQKKYPHLTSLEAVILDWRIMEYQERSVYQIMVNMEYRTSDFTSSKIKAMFGCISNQLDLINFKSNDDYSVFLELCKNKGDYSFIFNTSLSRNIEHQTWKPISYDFKPIYPWLYCYGEGQKGKHVDNCLELYDIIIETQGKINDHSLSLLNRILNYNNKDTLKNNILEVLKQNLKELDFSGNYNPVELPSGYFFNQFQVELTDEYIIGICTGVQWTFGAPAMLLKKNINNESYDFLSSGVFFGKINKTETSPLKIT